MYRLLGVVNSQGTAFEAPTLATGMGGYLAQVKGDKCTGYWWLAW